MEVNYHTTHALQALKALLPRLREESVEDAEGLATLLPVWDGAVKFVCPPNGLFFEDKHFERYTPYFRLPYKATVLEYDATYGMLNGPESMRKDLGVSLLAMEDTRNGVLGADVFIAYEDKSTRQWMVLPGYLFIPYGEGDSSIIASAECTAFLHRTALRTWAQKKGLTLEHNRRDVIASVGSIMIKESMSLFQFSVAMSCSNVSTEIKKAPKFTNQRRVAKGKMPLYEYHLLTVDVRDRDERGEAQGGTHASPRQHLRRGHVRRYKTGLTIWINEMVVSRTAEGRIDKDYRVRVKKA